MAALPSYPWFVFPVAGWGVALLIHCLVVYVFTAPALKERLERRVLSRLRES